MSISNLPVKNITYNGVPLEFAGGSGGDGSADNLLALIGNTIEGTDFYDEQITTIGIQLFRENTKIKNVTMTKLTKITSANVFNKSSVESVSLPLCTTMGSTAFQGCASLTDVRLPSLTSLGYAPFQNTTNLKKVVFQSVTQTTSSDIFKNSGVEVVDFHTLTQLGYGGLQNATNLKTLIIRTPTVCKSTQANPLAGTPIASGSGFIYVPDNLVEDYKIETNMTVYANQYKPLSELPEEV